MPKTTKIARVPMVMQMENVECGAACLCMILAYFGKWLPLEQVRADCGVSRDGSSAKNILKAARAYGLKADGYRLEPSELRNISFPAILHWNLNHFVVLSGFKKNKVLLNDPSKGIIEVTLEELDKAFTGIVLRFETDVNFKKEGKPKSVWKFAMSRIQGSLPSLLFVMLMSILTAALSVIQPLFSRVFMDNILSGKNPEWLPSFVGAMAVVVALLFFIKLTESLQWLRIMGRFAITANAEFFWHVLRLPMEFFSQRWLGDITSRLSSNEQIAATLLQKLAPVLINIALLFFYLFFMINYNVLLSVIGIATVFVNIFVTRITAKKVMNLSRVAQAGGGKLAGMTLSGIDMIETIKASGAESGFFERWAGQYARQHNAQVSITRITSYFGEIPSLLQQMANIAILMCGVYLIFDGTFTIGMLLAFQGFISAFFSPVNQFLDLSQSLITMRVEMERVEDVLQYPIDEYSIDRPCVKEVDGKAKLQGAIEIQNITFGYNRLSEPIIKDFSVHITPGMFVAIIGGSGCGKSTLAKLITGLYKPWSGSILFDDKTRDAIDEYTFKNSVAMVDQDISLFEDTVASNIRLWDPSIEQFAVILAAKDADIHDTIISRPEGYKHIVKEGGKNFSGGQRQRIEIARVLALEPTILILDEATSALDAKTEETVMKNIRNIGATCIVIAHRLSTIRDCDEIIVLDKGVVVERGRHDELYAKGGKYTSLIDVE